MKTLKIFIFFSLFFCSHLLFSQPPPPNTNPTPLTPQVPIDGGVLTLLAAGVALGARHLAHKKKQEQDLRNF